MKRRTKMRIVDVIKLSDSALSTTKFLSRLPLGVLITLTLLVGCASADTAVRERPSTRPTDTRPATQATPTTTPTADAKDKEPKETTAGVAPSITLEREGLKAVIWVPDDKVGHYRGTRFDPSGMIGSVMLNNTVFWDEWAPADEPEAHDANATGPAMEFDIDGPQGYDDAKVGEGFMKIGVGVLKKRVADKKYTFSPLYEVLDPGERTISSDGASVTFTHKLKLNDLGYDFEKKVTLGDGHTMTIKCSLKNTGTKPIDTEVYTHNFLRLNGKGWTVGTLFNFDQVMRPDSKGEQPHPALGRSEDGFKVIGPIRKGASVWQKLDQFDKKVKQFAVSSDGAAVDITIDFPASRFVIFGLGNVTCVEPFYQIHVEPGQQADWSYLYKFINQ